MPSLMRDCLSRKYPASIYIAGGAGGGKSTLLNSTAATLDGDHLAAELRQVGSGVDDAKQNSKAPFRMAMSKRLG
jgi:ABC-type lipoprotein export system ATPase subunit